MSDLNHPGINVDLRYGFLTGAARNEPGVAIGNRCGLTGPRLPGSGNEMRGERESG